MNISRNSTQTDSSQTLTNTITVTVNDFEVVS